MAYQSYVIRAKEIQELTKQHYEPENQNKCYKAIWRRLIYKKYGVCYRTYLNYLRYCDPTNNNKE